MTLAQVLLRVDGVSTRAAIDSVLAEAERLVAATGARSRAPFVHLHRAELARLSGDLRCTHASCALRNACSPKWVRQDTWPD
jgi:hypothetical protein